MQPERSSGVSRWTPYRFKGNILFHSWAASLVNDGSHNSLAAVAPTPPRPRGGSPGCWSGGAGCWSGGAGCWIGFRRVPIQSTPGGLSSYLANTDFLARPPGVTMAAGLGGVVYNPVRWVNSVHLETCPTVLWVCG